MINHRHHNRIFSLKDKDGNRVTQQDEIEHLLVEHFKGILSEPNINRAEDIDKSSLHIPRKFLETKTWPFSELSPRKNWRKQ